MSYFVDEFSFFKEHPSFFLIIFEYFLRKELEGVLAGKVTSNS
jgi:hypothetical protein